MGLAGRSLPPPPSGDFFFAEISSTNGKSDGKEGKARRIPSIRFALKAMYG